MTELPHKQRFDTGQPEEARDRDAAFARAQRHSRRVSVLKRVLPLSAGILAVAFAAYSYSVTPGSVSINVAESAISDGRLVMASPKLEGFTRENKPYSMSAVRAFQDLTNTGLIELEDISAKLPFDNDTVVTLNSPGGMYNRDANTLDIKSSLSVKTSDGMSADLKSAFIDIATGSVRTKEPVDIKLKGTRVQADSMTIEDRGKRMVFDKRVRMVIEPSRIQTQQKGNGS